MQSGLLPDNNENNETPKVLGVHLRLFKASTETSGAGCLVRQVDQNVSNKLSLVHGTCPLQGGYIPSELQAMQDCIFCSQHVNAKTYCI